MLSIEVMRCILSFGDNIEGTLPIIVFTLNITMINSNKFQTYSDSRVLCVVLSRRGIMCITLWFISHRVASPLPLQPRVRIILAPKVLVCLTCFDTIVMSDLVPLYSFFFCHKFCTKSIFPFTPEHAIPPWISGISCFNKVSQDIKSQRNE